MTDKFKKIGKPLTIGQEIVKNIEDSIRQRKLAVDEKLPSENELCEIFGVSRTALREAMQMLSAKGLITIKKGKGIFVNNFSTSHASEPMSFFLELNFNKDYILYLMQVRKSIEPQIAMLAAKHRTEEDLKHLEENLEQFEKYQDDFTQTAQLDLKFHLKIAEATKNPLFSFIMDPLYKLLPKIKTLIVKKVKRDKKYTALDYHRTIFEMIKNKNEQGALKAMNEHLRIAERDANLLIETLDDDEKLW